MVVALPFIGIDLRIVWREVFDMGSERLRVGVFDHAEAHLTSLAANVEDCWPRRGPGPTRDHNLHTRTAALATARPVDI